MASLLTRLRNVTLVLTWWLAFSHPANAQLHSDGALVSDIPQVKLFTAPDESAPPAASVPRDDILAPMAQVVGTGGIKWYLVKTKSGVAGWIETNDTDTTKKLELFFKSLPAELSISSPSEISSAASTTVSHNTFAIPIQMNGSAAIVPVVLNRTVQTNMILDTGASFTVVSQQLARRLGLHSTTSAALLTANGTIGAPLAPLESLKIGDTEVTNLTVVIRDFSPAPSLGGLLGLDFLSQYHTAIDSRRQLLILAPK